MPGKGYRKDDALDHRLKVGLTNAEAEALSQLADAAGLSQAGYVRQMIRHALGAGSAPKTDRQREAWHRLSEVHELAVQIRKLGATLAVVARELDAKLHPETHANLIGLHSAIEGAMAKAVAIFDAILSDVQLELVES